jgi:transposase
MTSPVGAHHRVLRLEVSKQRQHHREVGIDAQCREALDAQVAVAGQGLHRLLAADGGAGEDALERIVLQADQQSGCLGLPCR